jgi:hypothetical protein
MLLFVRKLLTIDPAYIRPEVRVAFFGGNSNIKEVVI